MKTSLPDPSPKPSRPRRSRWLIVLAAFAALAWSLPRPQWQNVVIESDGDTPRGRLAFRTAERLVELSGKGAVADETELSGPCFADAGQTLYFSRSQPGQRANIVRSQFTSDGWSKPDVVKELNSVDDDRRLTLSGDGEVAALASNRSGGHGGFDIYESAQSNDRWSRPRNAGPAINTEAEEFDPALTPDGLTMYFVRVAPGSRADILITRRDKLDSAWSAPELAETINSPDHHERSPAVSPDGSWLLFASNRGDQAGESAPFGLFRAPLRDGHVGVAERLRDGIASDTDDVDAGFAPNGQSLVFASKREGAKQIFLSRGEFVIPRLTISTEHLAPFGPREGMLPILATLVLILAWRWALRAPRVVVVETPKTATISTPLRRSEPPKNPLQTWTVAPAEQTPPSAPAVNPLTVAKVAEPITISHPVTSPADPAPSRRLRWGALAVVVAASVAFVVLRTDRTDHTTSGPATAINELWSEFAQFSDVAPPRAEEFPKLERTNTSRTDAPQSIAPPSNLIALRPGARWPADRVTVRQPSELVRVDGVEQRLLSLTKNTVLARQSLPTKLTRPLERPTEEAVLAGAVPTVEKPHSLAPISTTKQVFDPPAAERTAMQPVAMNQAVLRAPIARLDQLVPSASPTLSDSRRDSLARSGAGTRSVIPRGLTEPESLIGANPAAVTVEASLPARVVSLSRTESVLVNQPKPLSSSLPLERRALLIAAPDQSLVATAEVPRPTNNLESTKLPMRSPALPKAASLIEEVIVPTPKSSSSETNALSPSATLSRRETSGPQPTLSATANGLTTTRAELITLRTTNRLDAAEIAMLTTKTPPVLLTRRETRVAASVSVAAVDLASGMGTAAPGILLTSTSMLVELLASAPLPAVPRTDSGSPAAAASLQPISQLVLRVARTWTWTATNGLPAATDPTPVIAKSSLPRQVRETVPAELIETIPATP